MAHRVWSIHGRLRRRLVTGTGLILISATVILYLVIQNWLRNEFDQALESKARALMTLTEQDTSGVELEFADEYMPEFERDKEPEYFQLWIDDRTVLERSRSLGTLDLPHLQPRFPQPRFADLKLPDGRNGRLVQIDFVPQVDDDDGPDVDVRLDLNKAVAGTGLHVASIAVARSRENLDARLTSLVLCLGGFVAVFISVIAWLVSTELRFGLRPLEIVARQIRELDAESLDGRIGTPSQPKELAPLVNCLNDLLNRLHQALVRERTLSSNLAHELRTPIAELRNLAEVGARWPRDTSKVREYFEDSREIAGQMERIVVHLLSLSRLEAGIEVADKRPFFLAPLVQSCWPKFRRRAAEQAMSLCLDPLNDCKVETDRDKLEIMITNLLSNAIVHGKQGHDIMCSIAQENGHAKLIVANRSDELVASDLPHLFDRFWRKDAARSNNEHGGLGLSMVHGLAELLDIEVQVGLEPTGIFHISLMIPRPARGDATSIPHTDSYVTGD